jgi:glycosyltransferase involved in cell wall biosynthesis
MKIAVVLPVFNEEKKISDVLDTLSKIKLPIFLVDDGSTDKTLEIIKNKTGTKSTLVSHKINLGKGSAMRTGAELAFNRGFEAVIFMDSDGQHSPKDLSKFVEKLKTGKYDIVLGSRNLHHGVPLIRFLGNKSASVLISVLFGIYVSDILSGFRAVTYRGYKKMNIESSGYGIETEIIVKMSKYKLKNCEIPIETIYHDKHKGVTILDSLSILFDVFRWRIVL